MMFRSSAPPGHKAQSGSVICRVKNREVGCSHKRARYLRGSDILTRQHCLKRQPATTTRRPQHVTRITAPRSGPLLPPQLLVIAMLFNR